MMFRATVRIQQLLDTVTGTMGLVNDQPRSFYLERLNACLIRLYADVIRDIGACQVSISTQTGELYCSSISPGTLAATVRAQDICAVQCGAHQLQYLPPLSYRAAAAGGWYYTLQEEKLYYSCGTAGNKSLTVYCRQRPINYTTVNETAYIPLPDEYISLLEARLRFEGYRIANEDALAAKWLSEYQSELADLKAYLEEMEGGRVS